jgi:tetratricopeptide (TPR) repeat protein
MQKTNEAIACYREALLKNSEDPELHNNFAVVLKLDGQKNKAVLHLEEALKLKPGYTDAQRNLSALLAKEKDSRK